MLATIDSQRKEAADAVKDNRTAVGEQRKQGWLQQTLQSWVEEDENGVMTFKGCDPESKDDEVGNIELMT